MNPEQIEYAVLELKRAKTDSRLIEVKESVGKLPASLVESISAFANGSGGTIVLGLSEQNDFSPAKGFNARRAAGALSQTCSDKLTPPVRADIDIITYDDAEIVVASIEEMPPRDKPCYVTSKGMYRGSFIRSFDGNHKLSPYEIDRLLEDKTQPAHDTEIVPEATMDDLDENLFKDVILRQRTLHPRVFANLDDESIAVELRIAAIDEKGILRPTIAGLLALGTYPQKYWVSHFFHGIGRLKPARIS